MKIRKLKRGSHVQRAIVRMRRELGLSQSALAHDLGSHQATISKWELTRAPEGEDLFRLYQYAQEQGIHHEAAVFLRYWAGENEMECLIAFAAALVASRMAAGGEFDNSGENRGDGR